MQRYVVRRIESHFEAPDGTVLFRRAWLSPDVRRALILLHGMADHSGRYDHVGSWFATHHCAVHALDLRGHGRSEGPRCHVDRFDDYLDDLQGFVACVREEHPGVPIVVVGHSMGGLIAISLFCERRVPVDLLVVTAAALEVGRVPSAMESLAVRLLRRFRPQTTLALRLDAHALSRDPEVVRAYLEDPLVPRRVSVSLALEFLAAAARMSRRGATLQVPTLLLHGDMDTLCLPRGARSLYNQMRTPGAKLLVYPKLRHELLNEPEQEQVFEDVNSWILERES